MDRLSFAASFHSLAVDLGFLAVLRHSFGLKTMKNILAALILVIPTLSVADDPEVQLELLSGQSVKGKLIAVNEEEVRIETADGARKYALVEVLEVRQSKPQSDDAPPVVITLIDETVLGANEILLNTRRAEVKSARYGDFSLAFRQLRSLRFIKPADEQGERWNALHEREETRDLLVIPKTRQIKQGESEQSITVQTVDFLKGTVSEIADGEVKFVYNGQTIPVKLEKVFGIVLARQNPRPGKATCVVSLGGDRIYASSVVSSEGKLALRLAAGADVTVSPSLVKSLDFSQGKIQYLSAMEPREYEHTEFFGFSFDYSKDKTGLNKKPLRLGGRDYNRGLWIHSKTFLKYRLGGEYRRFQAIVGIDEGLANKALGDVKLTISGDGKVLFEKVILGKNPPEKLDLEVPGVRDLEILVDWVDENDLGYCDHLDLADAKVVK